LGRALAGAALVGLALPAVASSQSSEASALGDKVAWTASATASNHLEPGGGLKIILRGAVEDGWHVYALTQSPDGPTPLRVTIDSNPVAIADGEPEGSPPDRIHDSAFDLDTQSYAHAFTVTVPVHIESHLAAGRHLIPLSVRFQTCRADICHPPKTVRVTASIDVPVEG